ncbi:MAG TPA: Mth938-like domain-containing protein [Beijerinckiaceae bacterium]|jgi:uncharacterized protein|nr:Mth938-like domain-containing protein [Beijerinckiaceae bacterium]
MPEPAAEGFVAGLHPIESYGDGGFRFAGMSHRGSILALPSGIRAWSAVTLQDIDLAALDPVLAEPRASVELLLLGTGKTFVMPSQGLRAGLKAIGIGLDPMATAAAISTYNILLGENRRVAAALLAVI